MDEYPTISADGKRLAFTSNRSGNQDVWLLDNDTGKLTRLAATRANEYRAVIAPDGSKVAMGRLGLGGRSTVHILNLDEGGEEKLTSNGGLMSWSSDSTKVVYLGLDAFRHMAVDLSNGGTQEVARHPEFPLYTGKYSPDDRWYSLRLGMTAFRDPIFIAPLRNGVAPSHDEWIEVTELSDWVGRNWWSPDGNLVYFLSLLDGNDCLWARRLDPATKMPLGDLFDVYHVHGPRRALSSGTVGFGLTNDKWYFTLHETIRNSIWLAEPLERE